MTAAAVAGANAGSPALSRPSDTGLAPSTSFAGSIASASSAARTPGGSGVCRMMPCTPVSADRLVRTALIALAAAVSPRSVTSHSMLSLAAARLSDRTYQAADSSPVARTIASRTAMPPAASAATRPAASSRSCAAAGAPGSARAVTGPAPPVLRR